MASERGRSTLIDKITPPPLAPHVVARPRILAAIDEAPHRRVTALAASAGFGKTTVLAMWAQDQHCAWYTASAEDGDPLPLARGLVASLSLRAPALDGALRPALDGDRGPDASSADIADALASTLSAALHPGLASDVTLVIDDLHEIPSGSAGMRLVAGLCHMAPRRLHLILASHTDLPFPVGRLLMNGQLLALTAEALRFDNDEAADLLASVGGPRLRAEASTVVSLTGGWPAAVRLVAERLATASQPERLLEELRDGGGAAEIVDSLLEAEAAPSDVRSVLAIGAALNTFNEDLLSHLGVPDAAGLLQSMRRRGVHITSAPRAGWYMLTPISREYALGRVVTAEELERVRVDAVGWYTEHGDIAAALWAACRTSDMRSIVDILDRYGSELLAAGHSSLVIEALARLDPGQRRPGIDLVEGEAREVRGDWDGAAECLSRLVPAEGTVPAAAAWRLGLIHHMRGEPERAMALYRRGRDDPDGAGGDRALAAAWGAAAAWLMGDTDECRSLVEHADDAAAPDDHRARAAIHTARAMLAALDGDRRGNDMHYVRALEHAERASDVLQVIRIRNNRGSRFIEEGYYAEALSELDTAIELAELAGYAAMHALALSNRGVANQLTGRFEEAVRDLEEALGIQQRIGSRMAGYALTILGAVHADQGRTVMARAAYEEAVALAEPARDLQGLVPALAGLARVVAEDEPDLAQQLLTRALAGGANLGHSGSLLAAGWVALRRDDRDAVREYAAEASSFARARRDRAALAEALELQAAAAEKDDERYARLREAESMWQALGCPLPLHRTRLALAQLDLRVRQAPADDITARVADIEQACRLMGARGLAADAAALRSSMTASTTEPAVSVRTLGGFRVLRGGVAVPHQAWQSRKARDLLKILVAHRGAPVARDQLCEFLWPQVDPARAGNRLSVAISTLRLVLDPTRVLPSDHYVASGEGAVWLRRERVSVDVESFLRKVDAGMASHEVADLVAAEAEYAGEFCAEDPYADWAEPLRQETRSAYVAVQRVLAQHHASTADHDTAVRHLHRLLACEPYDEQASLLAIRELDAAGRHGDARRLYRSYVERMAELAIEPAPYPA